MSSTEQLELDRETIGRIDPTDQLTDVLAHPRASARRAVEGRVGRPGAVGLARTASSWPGMGGSAIGGHLARAILGDHASRPLLGARAYGLPPWTTPDTTVLCASYSGNTEETLACYEAAGVIGARRVVVTTGGKLAELARADQRAGGAGGGRLPAAGRGRLHDGRGARRSPRCAASGPRMNSELDVAADHLEELVIEWGPEGAPDGLAKSLARALHGTVPVVAGAGLTTPIAYRWKTQVNENAKMPAYALELPELDHNEIVGWGSASEFGRFSAVFLDDADTASARARRASTSPRSSSRRAPSACIASSRAARRPPSASSRSCCSATSCRSTSPRCAASTPSRSRSSIA